MDHNNGKNVVSLMLNIRGISVRTVLQKVFTLPGR